MWNLWIQRAKGTIILEGTIILKHEVEEKKEGEQSVCVNLSKHWNGVCPPVVQPQFMCLMHSKAKQIKMSRVWSRERFIAGAQQGEWVVRVQKTQTPRWLSGKCF